MRTTTFLSLVFLLPTVLSNPTATSPELERGYGGGHHPRCRDIKTRDHDTCECLPGFQEPRGWHWKKEATPEPASALALEERGGWGYEECVCPDYPNTYVDYDGWGHGGWRRGGKGHGHGGEPECKCKGDHQTYNPYTEKCECDEGWEPVDDWYYDKRGGKHGGHKKPLKCKPCPTPSGGYGHKGKAQKRSSFVDAVKVPGEGEGDDRALETLLGCKDQERACESHGTWSCTDVSSSLWSCGGCPGQGVDCGAVPGVSEVRCEEGHCVIDSCRRGYTIKQTPDAEYGTNTTCAVGNDRKWSFVNQVG